MYFIKKNIYHLDIEFLSLGIKSLSNLKFFHLKNHNFNLDIWYLSQQISTSNICWLSSLHVVVWFYFYYLT